MQFADSFKEKLNDINEDTFESKSLELFSFQYHECSLYNQYCNLLRKNPKNVKNIHEIPFLPIEFFKNHAIKSGKWEEETIFKSSGTTQTGRSSHYVRDLGFYHTITKKVFERAVGSLSGFKILALLPSYQQQGDSSLIAMTDYFMKEAGTGSGYFLDNYSNLAEKLGNPTEKKLLIGVSYALLDFAESHPKHIENVIFMETGGMKGRRKELTRDDLHKKLKKSFNQETIYSEYGMTELMSQAYGENGEFRFPPWAKALIRDINDPFCYLSDNSTGGINIIDLANVDSCAFLETKDLGRTSGELFEVLGRFDNSDVRGCNLMIRRNM